MQPGNRYYLFKDLIRCNCLDVTQTIKSLTLLYTARGFLSFCPPWGLTPSPSQGRGVHKHHCSALQPCTESSSPAGSSLPARVQDRGCSHGREMSPLGHLSRQGSPLLPRELLALSWEELQPSLNSAGLGAQAPAEGEFLLTLSFLFCFLLSQVSPTDLALGKHFEWIRSSSEWGMHLPTPSYSQNNPKFLGQLPQSFLPSLPLLLPSKRCFHLTSRLFLIPSLLFSHIPSNWQVLKVHQPCWLICIW